MPEAAMRAGRHRVDQDSLPDTQTAPRLAATGTQATVAGPGPHTPKQAHVLPRHSWTRPYELLHRPQKKKGVAKDLRFL
jgi:hypothetical protein